MREEKPLLASGASVSEREREREREETERLNERKHLSTNELPFFFQIVNMFLVEKKILSFTEKLI